MKFIRHRDFRLLCACFILSAAFVFPDDSEFPSAVEINPDQLGQSTFYYDRLNPLILTDLSLNTLRLDGTIREPLGRFTYMDGNSQLADSTTLTWFDWRQGDYGYRQIIAGLASRNVQGTHISFSGSGRKFPGRYAHLGTESNYEGNVLQNYLLTIRKEDDNRRIRIDTMVNLEDVGLPSNTNENHYRQSESYLLGGNYGSNFGELYWSVDAAFQQTRNVQNSYSTETSTRWMDVSATKQWRQRSQLFFKYQWKSVIIEDDEGSKRKAYDLFLAGLKYMSDGRWTLSTGVFLYPANTVSLMADLQFRLHGFEFFLSGRLHPTLVRDVSEKIRRTYYTDRTTGIRYEGYGIAAQLAISHVAFGEESWYVVNPDFRYSNDWLDIRLTGNYPTVRESIYSGYLTWDIRISPELKGKRYRPFIQLSGTSVNFNGGNVIDLLDTSDYLGYSNDGSFNANFFQAAGGVKVKNFILEYRAVQPLQNGQTVSPEILPVERLTYLHVYWMFDS